MGIYHSEAARCVSFFGFTHLPLKGMKLCNKEAHEKNMNIACYF